MKHDREWWLDRLLNLVGSAIGAAASAAVALYVFLKTGRR